MEEIQFRMGNRRFYDDKAFPRGFAKSGNFTRQEEELLVAYGGTMSDLESGRIAPENDDEYHFLFVLHDPSKAKSKLEKVWLKYVKLARERKPYYTLNVKRAAFGWPNRDFEATTGEEYYEED
ncbi:DUF413 domain-containing protein [Thaumasiovibrio subtropicus]|uniref:DUF413 domain-containing protein n=1 Tax=Thaumasiovibrio subtropicus TaxID=1891207 RepID=UPI000B35E968|nr:DUF413 domain-containing protein [Thaumasiovibrio subtropicus]